LLPAAVQTGTFPIDVEPEDRLSVGLETTGCVVVTGAATTGAGTGVAFVSVFDGGTGDGAGVGAGALTITAGGATTGVRTLVVVVVCVGVDGVWIDVVVFVWMTGVVSAVGADTTGVVVELFVRCGESLEPWVEPVPLEPAWPVCVVVPCPVAVDFFVSVLSAVLLSAAEVGGEAAGAGGGS
jgi:hypothetical protein